MKGDKVRGLASHDTTVVDRMNDDDGGRRISIWRDTDYVINDNIFEISKSLKCYLM